MLCPRIVFPALHDAEPVETFSRTLSMRFCPNQQEVRNSEEEIGSNPDTEQWLSEYKHYSNLVINYNAWVFVLY